MALGMPSARPARGCRAAPSARPKVAVYTKRARAAHNPLLAPFAFCTYIQEFTNLATPPLALLHLAWDKHKNAGLQTTDTENEE